MCVLCWPDASRRSFLSLAPTVIVAAGAAVSADTRAARAAPPEIALPDSAPVQAALVLARAAMPPFLLNHCLRTYAFGVLLAERQGQKVDRELLFVAAALHDLGLTEGHMSANQRFEVDSADAAKRMLIDHGVPVDRAERVWEAIALHSSPGIAPRFGAEAAYTHLGAGMDVFGRGVDMLPHEAVEMVVAEYPREGFDAAFRALLLAYARRKPLAQLFTWTDQLARSEGVAAPTYDDLVRRSPFAEASR